MGNKQGHELSPEEKQKLKEEKEREKKLLKEEKERRKREKKEEKRRKKDKKRNKDGVIPEVGEEDEDADSVGGSSQWSEKSVGSAPGSWYHSASEPSSKRSSIYLPASAGPGYYQHDCWYPGYEDSGSEKSKSPSRAPSVKDTLNLRASSLERYPLGVPTGEPIEPLHKAGSLDLSSAVAKAYMKEREKRSSEDEISATIASRYDETIRTSRDHLERTSVEKLSRFEKIVAERVPLTDSASLNSSVYHSAEEGSIRGEKRKASVEDRGSPYVEGVIGSDTKRQSLDYASDHTSVTGSIYYSADEGGSIAGSVYYSATSGSEVEDHGDDQELLGKERPSAPGKPEAVDREGSALSRLAYIKVENDALLLRWEQPVTDGGSPITGYIIERSEGQGEMWVRVNLVPVKDTEYAVANLIGGREYRFRVSAENAVGMSEPSPPSETVSISTDQEATEPHFLKELRDAVAVEKQKVEFSVDIIGTPLPDITWYKDGFEVYDTRRFEFRVEGDRYTLVLKEAKLTDEGDIRVRATNRVGVASSQATLRVEAPPQVKLPAQYEQGLIFDTDELIRLRVPYTGRPQPQATWTHNGKQIDGDERHTMDVSDKYATLKIAGACRTDKGMYTLKLVNPQGEETSSFFVTVTDRPDPPSVPTITDVSGTSVTLRWDPPQDDGGCRVSNYILEYFRVGWDVWLKAVSSRITWTQLSDLIVGSEYRFRVKAENAYGVSEPGEESYQILIEEAKSPSGYENLGTNGGRYMQNCDEGNAPEGVLVGTPVGFHELSTQSGMVIETVSLMKSQSQYEEYLKMREWWSKSFNSEYDESDVSDDELTLIEQQCHDAYISSSDTDSCASEILGDRLSFLSNRSGTLSLDQSTTSLLGPLSPYSLNPPSSLRALALWSQLGIVSGGLTPARYLGTIRGISTDSDDTGSMNSPTAESCGFEQNFIATTQVYHSWATPCNSPTADNLHTHTDMEGSPRAQGPPANMEAIDENETRITSSLWTKFDDSPVVANAGMDMSTNTTSSKFMKSASGNRLINQPRKTSCDEIHCSSYVMRDVIEDGSVARQSAWGGVEESTVNRTVQNVGDSSSADPAVEDLYNEVSANPAVVDTCNEGITEYQEEMDLYGEDGAATPILRDGAVTPILRDVYNEGFTANRIIRDVYNEGPTPDRAVRNVSITQPAASAIVRRSSNEPPQVNQVAWNISNVSDTDNEFARSMSSDGAARANQEIGNSSYKEDPDNLVVRTLNNDGDINSRISRVENEVTAAGGQWTTRGRIAIANQFRIICGGLASMTHLGNISIRRRISQDESSCSYASTREDSKTSGTSLDSRSSARDSESQCEHWVSDTPAANQKGLFSLGGSTINMLRRMRKEKLTESQRDVRKQQQAPAGEPGAPREESVPLNSPQISALQNEATANTNQNRVTQSVRSKDVTSRAAALEHPSGPLFHSEPTLPSTSVQESGCHDFRQVTEDSLRSDQQKFDEISSWEPKINEEITSRIDLLENLVCRCLENEDVTMNTLGASDSDGSGTPSPLAALSPVSFSGRVDVRRGELKDLISDLGELVSGMNEKSRTLSAENVAKFFEKTACVARDHSLSPTMRLTSDHVVGDSAKSNQSSRTHSLSEVEWLVGDLSHSSESDNLNDIPPYDQVHIQSSILDRITYLDTVMNRCLENEDVTLNTLGSPVVSPNPAPSAELQEERIDASKIELKDLIGDLGSMVDDLGQKFNA